MADGSVVRQQLAGFFSRLTAGQKMMLGIIDGSAWSGPSSRS